MRQVAVGEAKSPQVAAQELERTMLSYLRRHVVSAAKAERGITGLETAIILIAFVVVASVFAYTVLTAGVFSSQKSGEAVNAAIDEVRSSIKISGNTIAYKGAVDIDGVASTTTDRVDAVVRIALTIGVALQGVPIDVTPAYQIDATNKNLESSGKTSSLVINFIDQRQVISNAAWTVEFSGTNDGDFSLWNGQSPTCSRPRFFSATRRPINSAKPMRAFNSSTNSGG